MTLKRKEKIQRIIYWWRRYMGERSVKGKDYTFSDIDILEARINALFDYPHRFDFDNPDMSIDNFGYTYIQLSKNQKRSKSK